MPTHKIDILAEVHNHIFKIFQTNQTNINSLSDYALHSLLVCTKTQGAQLSK